MVEERRESRDSVDLVYGLARAAYCDQFAQRDQQRTRCGALLAFAGIVWFSLEITPRVRQLADQHLLSNRDAATPGGVMRKDVEKNLDFADIRTYGSPESPGIVVLRLAPRPDSLLRRHLTHTGLMTSMVIWS